MIATTCGADSTPRRGMVVAPALALTQPVVDTADPTVEGLLLASPQTGQRSIALANWAYGVTAILKTAQGRRTPRIELLPVEKLTITVRGTGPVSEVRSCLLDKSLPHTVRGDTLTIQLDRLDEGDVLLLK